MRTFELTMERRARVWVDSSELPEMIINVDRGALKSINAHCNGSKEIQRRTIVVELFIPLGGRFLYGMLGGRAIGNQSSQSIIEIADMAFGEHGDILDSLVGSLDFVSPQVGEEYHNSILEGASTALEMFKAFPNKFVFDIARQGARGSTPILFRRLSYICIALLATPDEDIGRRLEELVNQR